MFVRLALVLTWCQVACAAELAVTSFEPSALFLGPQRELVLVGGDGRRSTRDLVFAELVQQARRVGYYQVVDLSREGFQTKVDGDKLQLEAFDRPLGEHEVGLWIDILSLNGSGDREPSQVELSVAAFNASGEPLIHGHRVVGECPNDDLVDSERAAATNAARELLGQITPSEIVRYVPLDEEDAKQIPILEVALGGNIARAREDMKAYVEREPANASAIYNLAVLTEAMGKLSDALALYDRALSLAEKSFYETTRQAAAYHARLDDAVKGTTRH